MHGYAHNRLCQTTYHPNYLEGAGLEDFEGCERVFSSSNDLARITRFTTPYHRHQRIDIHFQTWDSDHYANLGTFAFENAKQAIGIIQEHDARLAEDGNASIINDEKCAQWLRDEKEYLSGLKKEPEEATLGVEYVEGLEKYYTLE